MSTASLARCHPGIRWGWGCWSYVLHQVSDCVFIGKNICLSSKMLSYDVGIVPVGVLDLGWLETRGVSILKHQCASAPRTSGTCRLFLMADLSLKKKKDSSTSDAWHYYQSFRIIIIQWLILGYFLLLQICLLPTIKRYKRVLLLYLIRTCSTT